MKNSTLGAFTMSGNFDAEMFYSVIYDKVPSKYMFEVNIDHLQLDSEQIKFESIKDLFTSIEYVRLYSGQSVNDDEDFVLDFDTDLFHLETDESCSLVIAADNKVVAITYKSCTIYYDFFIDSYDDIVQLSKTIFDRLPKVKQESKAARVGLIKYNQGDYYTSFSDIKNVDINIDENYNDDFKPVYKDLVDFLNQRESGLVLLHGIAGSGKTSLIRHLCSNVPKDYVIVPNNVACRLGDPDFVSYITSCRDYVFILEDCEQLLVDRSDNPWNNAITTILNMADGLLSDVVNIKFICTFNAEVDKIDKALLRKRRCFAKYEFKELCEEKVKALNDKYNLGIKEIKPMTLDEIYNSDRNDYTEVEPETKIGF